MTYIDYLNNFNRWLESNALPSGSQLLYYKLLDVFNRAGWTKYVQVDNLRIMFMMGVRSEKAAITARNALAEAGFITYQRGKKGYPGKYFLSEIHCFKDSISDSVSGSVSDSVFDSESDSVNASHNKTKKKNKTKTKKESVKRKSAARFSPPARDEIEKYCGENGIAIDVDRFIDHYTANGWRVGRNPMEDWRATVRNWAKRDKTDFSGGGSIPAPPVYTSDGLFEALYADEEDGGNTA